MEEYLQFNKVTTRHIGRGLTVNYLPIKIEGKDRVDKRVVILEFGNKTASIYNIHLFDYNAFNKNEPFKLFGYEFDKFDLFKIIEFIENKLDILEYKTFYKDELEKNSNLIKNFYETFCQYIDKKIANIIIKCLLNDYDLETAANEINKILSTK